MKNKLTSLIILAASLVTAAHAQLTLHNFSSLVSPQTVFFGDWSDTGDPFAGSETSAAQLTQGAGFFSVNGASNADVSYFEHTFASALNLGASDQLSLSLRLLSSNTADSLTVFLLDSAARTASATFLASDFSGNAFSEISLFFTADAGFDAENVSAFRVSGNDPFGGGLLGVELDNLASVNAAAANAVPEPSTYGLMAAGVLTAVAIYRRRRKL